MSTKYAILQHLLEAPLSVSDVLTMGQHELVYVAGAIQFDTRDPDFRRNMEVCEVPIAKLHWTQEEVDSDRIALIDPDTDPEDRLPIVIDYNGDYVIFDGHHRAIRAAQRGSKVVKVRLVHIKTIEFDDDLELQIEYQK